MHEGGRHPPRVGNSVVCGSCCCEVEDSEQLEGHAGKPSGVHIDAPPVRSEPCLLGGGYSTHKHLGCLGVYGKGHA